MKMALLLSILFSVSAFAQSFLNPISPLRHEGESYQDARNRAVEGNNKGFWYYDPASAESVAANFGTYEFPEMEQWSSYRQLLKAFRHVRDLRFIDWEYEGEDFPRRSSWLYPDDGCFIRAELMVENLLDFGEPLPMKIFAIGNLKVDTPNAVGGRVNWWYHVAPIVKLGKFRYVIDPALKTKKPLRLEKWLSLMNENVNNIKIAVCGSRAMVPSDNCAEPFHYELDKVVEYQYRYLAAEWQRLIELDRNPVTELGDAPPWSWKYFLFGSMSSERFFSLK